MKDRIVFLPPEDYGKTIDEIFSSPDMKAWNGLICYLMLPPDQVEFIYPYYRVVKIEPVILKVPKTDDFKNCNKILYGKGVVDCRAISVDNICVSLGTRKTKEYRYRFAKDNTCFDELFLYQYGKSSNTDKSAFRDIQLKNVELSLSEYFKISHPTYRGMDGNNFKLNHNIQVVQEYIKYLKGLTDNNMPIDGGGALFPCDVIDMIVQWNAIHRVFEDVNKSELFDFLNNIGATNIRLKVVMGGSGRYLGLIRLLQERTSNDNEWGMRYVDKTDGINRTSYGKKGKNESIKVQTEISL